MSVQLMAQKPTKTANPNDEWEIRWSASDEFNGDSPDWAKWIRTGNLPNTTAWKWDNANNVKIVDGVAELTMRQNPNNQNDGDTYFKSGILKSYQTFTYGYYEAKIKGASIGEGVCPSFWLFSNFDYSVGNGKTVYSEIDVVELQQFDWYEGHQDDIQDMDHNLHAVVMENGSGVWRRPKMHPDEQLLKYRAPWDPRDEFHIYGCEVNEQEIIWYVDGVEIGRKPNTYWYRPMNVTLSLGLRKPFVEFYNNRNNAVNPEEDERAKAALPGMPTTMFVDYVRVWEKTGTNNNPELGLGEIGNPDFEEGSLNYWNAGSGIHDIQTTDVANGNYGVTVNNGSVAQNITLAANTTYTITASGKVKSDGTKAYFGINEAISNELVKNYEFTSTSFDNGSITFTTGGQEASYRLWFWSSTEASVDNFQIVEGDEGDIVVVPVDGVSLSASSVSIYETATANLSATVTPSNASNKGVTWSCSNTNVATVSNGVVTGVNEGTATVTVTTNDGNFTASATVTVNKNTNLIHNPGFELADMSKWNLEGNASVGSAQVLSGSNAGFVNGNGSINQIVTLAPNKTYTLSAYGKVASQGQSVYLGVTNYTTSTFIENALITSTNYEKQSITFTTGSAQQQFRVWFWNNEGGQYYVDDWSLEEVTEGEPNVAVESVQLSNSTLDLDEGGSYSLLATVLPANATDASISWSSSNTSVASVVDGVVSAIAEGTATVTVTTTDGGFTATCLVTVSAIDNGQPPVGSTLPEAGSQIWLSTLDSEYVTVNLGSGTALQATETMVTSLEEYIVIESDGYMVLQNANTNKFVTAASGTGTPIKCGATGIFDRQKFTFELAASGNLLIKAKINGLYLAVDANNVNQPLLANATLEGATEFLWSVSSSSGKVTNIDNFTSVNSYVYPNPYSSGALKVGWNQKATGTIQLIDLQGHTIYSVGFNNQSNIRIAPEELQIAKGIYIIQIVTDTLTQTSKLIIK
ncbi:family 16 glycosylhydrolase [Flammeovirga sp. MY04]|nr:family 16 glycosylhydrolase [Flammeovirga sp. MY04]